MLFTKALFALAMKQEYALFIAGRTPFHMLSKLEIFNTDC
jgi:hypothetical protein